MKIVVLHEVGYLSKPVYEYQDFAERLAARGHAVTVIDFDEATREDLREREVSRTGLGRVRLLSLPSRGWPVLRYLRARWHFARLFRAMCERGEVDAVLVYSVFINGTIAVRICRRLGIPVVFRALDAYHRLRGRRLDALLLRAGERFIYRHADRVSATNAKLARYVCDTAGRDVPVAVLEHGVDTDHFRRRPRPVELARRLGLRDGDRVLVFLGVTYPFSRLDAVLEWLVEAGLGATRLLVIGAGPLDARLRELGADPRYADRLVLTGMIDYAELPDYLSLADLALNPFEINDITRDIVPIKMLQYMAASLPVVATPLPDLMRVLPHETSGVYYARSDSIADFGAALSAACRDLDLEPVGARAREHVLAHHAIARTIDRLEHALGAAPGGRARA